MQITRNVFTINDLNNWYEENALIINKDYQREGGIWVTNARTYFIDTILNEFPFPKITIRQIINLKTRKTVREIIDGQQRMMAINAFINSEYALSSVSDSFSGQKYSDFSPEAQEAFLRYEVSVDMVISATEEEVLEIFRRMNSYTLALNPPEQRHATYQGDFKWFIKDLIKIYSPMLTTFKVLTKKQVSRMADADLMTEMVQIILPQSLSKGKKKTNLSGVLGRNSKILDKIYEIFDSNFSDKELVRTKTESILNFIKNDLTEVGNSGFLTGYMLYSLFGALAINRYGEIVTEGEAFNNLPSIGQFSNDTVLSSQKILELFSAIDRGDTEGQYGEFVKACISTTHSIKHRQIRINWLAKALRNEL